MRMFNAGNKNEEIGFALSVKDVESTNKTVPYLCNKADTVIIDNIEVQAQASELLAFIVSSLKQIEAKRQLLVKPLNDHIKIINNNFKPATTSLELAKNVLSKKMAVFSAEEKSRIEKEKQAQIDLANSKKEQLETEAIIAVRNGNRDEAEALLQERELVKTKNIYDTAKVEGFHTRTTWKARVINKELVPDEFKIVDLGALNKLATVTKGTHTISGVEFYQETIGVSK